MHPRWQGDCLGTWSSAGILAGIPKQLQGVWETGWDLSILHRAMHAGPWSLGCLHRRELFTFLMTVKWLPALSNAGSWVASWRERQACSIQHARWGYCGKTLPWEADISDECAGRGTVPLKGFRIALAPASPSLQQ